MSELAWITKLRKEVLMAAKKDVFSFTRDELIQLLSAPAVAQQEAAQPVANERDAFEAWITASGRAHMLERDEKHGWYKDLTVTAWWTAWEKRAILAAVPAVASQSVAQTFIDAEINEFVSGFEIDAGEGIYTLTEHDRFVLDEGLRSFLTYKTAPISQDGKPAFPDPDPTKPITEQGLFNKFMVRRTDGSHEFGRKHYGCRYFVLDLTHDQHAPAAMRAYAAACRATHPQLADDIEREFGAQQVQDAEPITVGEILQWLNEAEAKIPSSLATTTITCTPIQLGYVAGMMAKRSAAIRALKTDPAQQDSKEPTQPPESAHPTESRTYSKDQPFL